MTRRQRARAIQANPADPSVESSEGLTLASLLGGDPVIAEQSGSPVGQTAVAVPPENAVQDKAEEVPGSGASAVVGFLALSVDLIRVQEGFNARELGDTDLDEAFEELKQSIAEHGLLEPVLVAPDDDGTYQLVAGERRYRACVAIGLTEIPAHVRRLTAQQRAVLMMVENLQRRDLSPMEEAQGIDSLRQHDLSNVEIAKLLGKTEGYISTTMRLARHPQISRALASGDCTRGHGVQLARLLDRQGNERWPGVLDYALNAVAKRRLSVASTAALVDELIRQGGVPTPEERIPASVAQNVGKYLGSLERRWESMPLHEQVMILNRLEEFRAKVTVATSHVRS